MLLNVLMALTVIMVTARLVGILFARLHQPAVMGEVVGGLLLGPSVLGRLSPDAAAFLLPPAAAPFLSVIAQLGVILYMFLVGLELDLPALRGRIAITLTISLASIVVPFALGIALAWRLYDVLAPDGVAFASFALFWGVSMAITAFPVLARILGDRGLQRTDIGVLALTCAAVNDAVAWCLLAFVVSVTRATSAGAIATAGLTAIYVALMLTAGRKAMIAVATRFETAQRIGEQSFALLLAAVLLSAVATEFIGIHAIFGAFLLGAIIPRDSLIATHVNERIEGIVRVMFLPAFFAFTGLRTEVGLVETAGDWLLCLIIIAVATLGKFGGTLLAARLAGLDWRNSAILGTLMNTRGLVELIVLNIGLDLGIITPRLFTMLVIMALVTTLMTSPTLSWLSLREERS